MLVPEKRIQYLLQSFSLGIITPEEKQELFEWVQNTDHDDEFFKDYVYKLFQDADEDAETENVDWEKLYQQIMVKSELNCRPSIRKVTVWSSKWMKAAAVVLVFILGTGAYFAIRPETGNAHQKVASLIPVNRNDTDKISNHSLAILKTGDKEVVIHQTDTAFHLGGNSVDLKAGKLSIGQENIEQYTLTTPKGARYQVVLADGTVVWLNTASSISYPSLFTGVNREVTVKGEAYFEVAKDKNHPFIVNADNQQIRVLGTSFNLQAYTNEPEVVTTLFTGSLRVSVSNDSLMLKPGQEASWNKEDQISLNKKADLDQAIAWKNGYFRFHKADLKAIMRQLARWYDLDVEYESGLKPQYFGGVIDRDNNIKTVLEMLEATNDIQFKLQGKKVIVAPAKP